MRKFILCSMFIVSLLVCDQAKAQQRTSYMRSVDLLAVCRVDKKDPKFCESYVAGIIDYHNLLQNFEVQTAVNFCIPPQYNLTQVTEIVMNDLAGSPQHDHFIAAPAVSLALFKAFPCKTRKK